MILLAACGTKVEEERDPKESVKDENQKQVEEIVKEKEDEESIYLKELKLKSIDGQQVFLVDDLFELIDGTYQYDDLHRSVEMEIDNHIFKLVYNIAVVEHNGLYLPTNEISMVLEEEKLYLPVSFLDVALGLDVEVNERLVSFQWMEEALPVGSVREESLLDRTWTIDEMVDYLSFLQKPIEDAEVSTIPNHLPGAKRAYRNGYHEGIDWYGYATGKQISTDTPIYAMAEGVVVRADHDYEEYPSPLIRNKDLSLTAQLGETPEYIFDRLRGKQVWVQYEKGVMNRFAHLDTIPEDLKVGDKVTSETIIGYVGNSGTSGAVNQDGTQLHLHQDLLIYGELFWKPFSLDEVKEIIVRIFEE